MRIRAERNHLTLKASLLLEFGNFFQLKVFVVLFNCLVNCPLFVLKDPHEVIVGFNLKEIELIQFQEHVRCRVSMLYCTHHMQLVGRLSVKFVMPRDTYYHIVVGVGSRGEN